MPLHAVTREAGVQVLVFDIQNKPASAGRAQIPRVSLLYYPETKE